MLAMLKAPRDSSLMDNVDGSESVIAACIQRFRYQAPSSSESRSHISREKFWWLQCSHEDNVLDDVPEIQHDSAIIDRFDAIKSSDDSTDSDDMMSLERDAPFPRQLQKVKEKLNHTSHPHTLSSSLPESSMTTNAQLDVVFNLDNYAERLLVKCDMLLKGYSTSSTGTRNLGNNRKSSIATVEFDSHRYHSVFSKSNSKALDNEEINNAIESVSENSRYDHQQLDSKTLRYSTIGNQDQKVSETDFSLNQSYSVDDITVSPIGLSLALSAESWGDLLTNRKELPQQENNSRLVAICSREKTAESNVVIGGIVPVDYSDVTASQYVPYLPSSCSSDHDTTVAPAILKSQDTFLYISSSSDIGATVRAVNRMSNQERDYHLSNNRYENYSHEHQRFNNYDEETDQKVDRGNDNDDSCFDNVVIHVDNALTEVSSNYRADSEDIDNENDVRSHNQGEDVSLVLSTSIDARSTQEDLIIVEQEFAPNRNSVDLQKPLTLSPLTEAEVSPYLNDALIHLLWTRLCIVRSQISQDDSHEIRS